VSSRFCSNCGHPLSDWARFCPHCGNETPGALTGPPVATIEEPPEDRANWRTIEGIGIFIVAVILTVLLTIPFAVTLSPASGCDRFVGTQNQTCLHHRDLILAITIGLNELALLGTVLLWVRLVHKKKPSALGFRKLTPVNALIGVGIGLGGLFVAGIINVALTTIIKSFTHRTVEAPQQIPVQDSPGGAVLAIIGISVILLAPLAEEAFFRGFVFQGLRRWARPSIAILISAAVFGLAHLIPLIMLPIFGLGILLASIVESRGSLVPSIVAHMTFNAIGFVQLFHAHL